MSYDIEREENEDLDKRYIFKDVSFCNMCSNPVANTKVMGIRLNQSQGRKPKTKTGIAVSVCKCDRCELVFSNPQPVPFDILDHYGIPPDEYWKEVSHSPEPGYYKSEVLAAKKLLGNKKNMKALDVGFGLGKGIVVLREHGFDVFGLEPSPPFYDASLAAIAAPKDDVRFQCCAIEDGDFESNTFDFITLGAVLEHLYNPAAEIEKCMEWMKPGGILHIEVPNSRHLVSRILNFGYKLMGTTFVTNLSPMHQPYHLFEFSIKTFEAHAKRANYEIADYWVDVASIYNIPSFAHGILRKIMEKNDTGMQLTIFLRKKQD